MLPVQEFKMNLEKLKNGTQYKDAAGKRRRGYDFEQYLFDCFEKSGFEIQRPYKTSGEQIDGGIYIDGQWYLVEIKWHMQKLPVSEVYAFKGKVDGKLTGTRGLFISWSGYSEECADALSLGKELNVILFDAHDVENGEKTGWQQVFKEKLRFAALHGEVYATSSLLSATKLKINNSERLELFAEGEFDVKIYEKVFLKLGIKGELVTFPCPGKTSSIRMASTLPKGKNTKRILILDSDGNPNQDNELADLAKVDLIISVEPRIEALLDPEIHQASIDPHLTFYVGAERAALPMDKHIDNLINRLIKDDEQGFISKITEFLGNKKSQETQ